VELLPSFTLEDSYFDLFPQEVRRLKVEGREETRKQDVKVFWNNSCDVPPGV
jgi:hypothetical protein